MNQYEIKRPSHGVFKMYKNGTFVGDIISRKEPMTTEWDKLCVKIMKRFNGIDYSNPANIFLKIMPLMKMVKGLDGRLANIWIVKKTDGDFLLMEDIIFDLTGINLFNAEVRNNIPDNIEE